MPNICGQCHRPVGRDDCSTHALSCNYLKGTLATVRHDAIQLPIEIFASRVGLIVHRHQRTDPTGQDKRTTDFTLYSGTKKCAYDVVCRHPVCPTAVHAASKTQLVTAIRADRDKHRHHHVDVDVAQAHVEPALREQPVFKAFACESFGGLHDDAAALILELCVLAQERPSVFTDYEMKYGLSAAIACAIQRHNAAMILENIRRAALPAAPTAPTYLTQQSSSSSASSQQPAPAASQPLSSEPIQIRTFVRSDRAVRLNAQMHAQQSSQSSIISISGVDSLLADASPPLTSSAHEFKRTMTGVSSMMHDDDDDASVIERRSNSMCMSRAFSVSVDSENDDARSVRSTFAVANSLNSGARIDDADDECMHA
jgi:hypothetical protein